VPNKPSISPVRWTPPPVTTLPDFGPAELTIVPMPGEAPEDVVVDADGDLWTGLADGRIVRVRDDGTTTVVVDTGGRPLGLHVARDGRLLICDSHRGLLALDRGTGAIETLVTHAAGHPLKFCSNVTETDDGTVYFTESTSRFHYEYFKAAVLEARGTGGLYRLAADGTVSTLADGLYFANGVTTTQDALVFAETQSRRLSKYWLAGPAQGTVTALATDLSGMPDNISTGADGRIWVALVCPVNTAADWLAARAPLLRQLVWRLPDKLQPQMPDEVWAVAFDPLDGWAVAGLRLKHPQFGQVTGLVEHNGRLWMSSIGHPALAHCAIPRV
jgi:sugar lactone lactonase YvrE